MLSAAQVNSGDKLSAATVTSCRMCFMTVISVGLRASTQWSSLQLSIQ